MEATQTSIDFYDKVIDGCNNDAKVKASVEEEFKTSVDAADMLRRQLQAYKLKEEATTVET
jgi:hypothetical protein